MKELHVLLVGLPAVLRRNKDCLNLNLNILQGHFTDTGAITWLPQCQWSNPEGYGKINWLLKWIHHKLSNENLTKTKTCGYSARYTDSRWLVVHITSIIDTMAADASHFTDQIADQQTETRKKMAAMRQTTF